METASILLTTEGTYPCHSGGVSVWCDKLIRGLPEFDFHLLGITGSPGLPVVFEIPKNVAGARLLPLWGTEEPGADEPLFSHTYRKKLRTTTAVIRERYLAPFEAVVAAVLSPGSASGELARAMLQLHQYFREYDYARSVSSPESWEAFLRISSGWPDRSGNMKLDEATTCMRWLQRYLAVLSIPYPRTDITHASMSGSAGIPGVIQKLLHGSRFLLSEHGLYLRELYISMAQSSYSPACKRFLLALNESVIHMNYEFADAVTSLCDFNRKWQVRLGADGRKISIVPNGVEEEIFFPYDGERCGSPVVLTMSRIMPLKGIDILLRAAMHVRERIPGVRFKIMGERAEEGYYQECMSFIHENHLEEMIEISHASDPASSHRGADVFCLPSISEAMPYSIIEAMFSGCPVVATAVGGVPELLGDTGLLVKPNDAISLADGLIKLLDGAAGRQRRRKLSAAALIRARKNYTLRHTIDRFRRIYEELGGAHLGHSYATADMLESDPWRDSLAASG